MATDLLAALCPRKPGEGIITRIFIRRNSWKVSSRVNSLTRKISSIALV